MAVLSKIRERSMFLIIIIGLALFAFVLDPSTIGDFINSNKVSEIGEVNGEVISRQEFASAVEQYKQQMGSRVSEMQASKTVWDNLLRKKIYQQQLEKAGVTVGESDVWNEVLNSPSVKNNPQFLNEAGLFDETKLKQFLADAKENNSPMWAAWSNYMNQIKENAERNTYNNLVTAGLGASLKEGENAYLRDNTKLDAKFVYVPYTSIADSLVTISKSEIEAYIKANPKDFKVEDSRDIAYVSFDVVATSEDENTIKKEVADLIEDFKSTTNNTDFFIENDSDLNLELNFIYKNVVNKDVAEAIFNGAKGDIFGPYKDKGYYKISKILETRQLPDSVKASHILIPFLGAQRAAQEVTRTKESAQKLADSLLKVVKTSKSKFASLAKEFSSDKGSAAKGGTYDWFGYNRMTPEFRDFTFEGNKGDMQVVQSPFGFHVIKIDDQKNKQTVVKLATFGKKIIASEATENAVFQKAEEFALAVSKGNRFFEAAKEKNYTTKQAVGLKILDENVASLGNQRQIVSWAFNSETKVRNFKRFDLEGKHIVASLTGKSNKGLMSAAKATNTVRPILVKQKKAKLLATSFKGANLQDIAKANNSLVRTANGVTFKSPTLSGVGSEPKVVGAMLNAKLNKLYTNVEGNFGVFAFQLDKKEQPTALPNYENARKNIAESRKRLTYKIYEAIKESSKIEDNRAYLYGVN